MGFSIGKVAARTGLAVSAVRFYSDQGLVHPGRNRAGRRVFTAGDIRRVSFIMIAQQLGFSLPQIKMQLARLPDNRTPTKADWAKMSEHFSQDIDARITALTDLKKRLTGCIGCGCLSLKSCALYNPEDRAARGGSGPRYLLGDKPLNS